MGLFLFASRLRWGLNKEGGRENGSFPVAEFMNRGVRGSE